ncbi:MAG: acyl-CoA dehydrogenase family protein, partial [Pseudomonadota bacterium]
LPSLIRQRTWWGARGGLAPVRPMSDILKKTKAFAAMIAEAVPAWERARAYPREAIVEAAAIGLTGIEVPREHGGLGLPYSAKARIAEILASADFGLAMAILNTQNVAQRLTLGAPHLAERYLPDLLSGQRIGCTALTEPGAGSDFSAIQTTATQDGDDWVLTGEKAWIINAAAADVICVYAQTQPGSGAKGIASFLVDARRPGFHRAPATGMTAQHTIGAGGFTLERYRAHSDEMLHPPGEAFRAALNGINGARVYVAAMCAGMVAASLETAARYGQDRQTFGKPLVQHQGWRWRLAEAETDLAAARLMVAEAAAMIDAGEDVIQHAARTKVFATRMAERHIAALAQNMGAEGLRDSHPFSRHLIGARTASLTDGSTEMLLERIASTYRRTLQ